MRLFGKSTKSEVSPDDQGITLTKVRFTNEFARRTYTIQGHTDIVYDYNNESFDHTDCNYSPNYDNCNYALNCEIALSNVDTYNMRNSSVLQLHNNTPDAADERQVFGQSESVDGTPLDITEAPETQDTGVVLLSLQHFNDDLPVQNADSDVRRNSESSQDTHRHSSSERQSGITQLNNTVNRTNVVPVRAARGNNSRSYNIVQESHDDPSEEVISMRLTRSALSEELMSRPPPSYELIVELTDGAYVKPLPPSYDSIFQTNKM